MSSGGNALNPVHGNKKPFSVLMEPGNELAISIAKYSENVKEIPQSEMLGFAIGILKASSDKRTAFDIDLLERLTSSIEFFEKMSSESEEHGKQLHRKFLECCFYEFYPKDSVVFEVSSVGEKFYVILKGEVSVGIPNKDKSLLEVAKLKGGASFGELALLDQVNNRRTATVTAKENSHLLSLSAENYMEVISTYSPNNIEAQVDILKETPFFGKWMKKDVRPLAYSFKLKTLKFKEALFLEGEEVNSLFLVAEGELKISKKLFFGCLNGEDSLWRDSNIQELYQRRVSASVEIMDYGKGTLFGGHEVIQKQKWLFSAHVKTETISFYQIERDVFMKRLEAMKFNLGNDVETFKEMCEAMNSEQVDQVLAQKQLIEENVHDRLPLKKIIEGLASVEEKKTVLNRVKFKGFRVFDEETAYKFNVPPGFLPTEKMQKKERKDPTIRNIEDVDEPTACMVTTMTHAKIIEGRELPAKWISTFKKKTLEEIEKKPFDGVCEDLMSLDQLKDMEIRAQRDKKRNKGTKGKQMDRAEVRIKLRDNLKGFSKEAYNVKRMENASNLVDKIFTSVGGIPPQRRKTPSHLQNPNISKVSLDDLKEEPQTPEKKPSVFLTQSNEATSRFKNKETNGKGALVKGFGLHNSIIEQARHMGQVGEMKGFSAKNPVQKKKEKPKIHQITRENCSVGRHFNLLVLNKRKSFSISTQKPLEKINRSFT